MTGRATVLVVDDEPQTREVLRGLLEGMGLDVREAVDGLAALAQLAERSVELVLLDLTMPRLGGLGLLERIREDLAPPLPPVIVLTALADPRSRSEAIKLGALDFVQKPFRLLDLRRRIRRALNITRLERRLDEAEQRLRDLRRIDQATGVGATSQLFDVLEAEFHAARVGERALTCIVASDESYGRILDSDGREAGEARLRALADSIEKRLRDTDRVFRVDAAELVILLPGCGREGAARAIGMIGDAVAELGTWGHDELVMAAATYPHPEINQASLLYRAVNLTLAQVRASSRVRHFGGF